MRRLAMQIDIRNDFFVCVRLLHIFKRKLNITSIK